MASIRKHKSGWRAEVVRKGQRRSKVLPTRQEAKDWAARQEYEILNAQKVAAAAPFGDVLDRYAREVSPGKRGHRWEVIRLERFKKDPIARRQMRELAASDFAEWRDSRLREVSPGTVAREMNLLSSVLTQARREWGMIHENPMKDVRKPSRPPARDRLVTEAELERMAHVAGPDLSTATARAFHAFRFAIETGMRAGEILSLGAETVDTARRVAHLPLTKNGTAREVPLSREAVRLWEALPGPGFDVSSRSLDSLFRKVRDKAGVEGLTFHDSRHAAVTRLARKLDVLTLAKVIGHRDIKMLMTYYDETAEDIAKRMD
ncbi:integrase [Marinibacterium profundimaris]|uniref:Integrase n=1 Tax=Marinibacterium profundimaris TaxID=1679460 RepID=A0A225P1J9_9RHOB|nr:integrase [Marinibacterium profundimaris]